MLNKMNNNSTADIIDNQVNSSLSVKFRSNSLRVKETKKSPKKFIRKNQSAESTSKNTKSRVMENSEALSLGNFKVLYVVTQLAGLTLVVLMACWVNIHLGGLGWSSEPVLQFNWHPLLMTIGLIFFYGNSILIYRGFRQMRKKQLKLLHASVHMAAFIFAVIGLIAVFDFHNAKSIPNMYSLHSWVGLATVILFAGQWVGGYITYLVPGLRQNIKETVMPYHIFMGLTGFILSIATALIGLVEKVLFTKSINYSELPNAALIANVMGLLMVLFGLLVVYLSTERSYKRLPLPEDAILLTSTNF